MKIVVFGLSITSSWGNGHATTFRALLRALNERGHDIVFFEKDVEWYASNRDLPVPGFCKVRLYERWTEVLPRVRAELSDADVAMVGSYFPDGMAAMEEMQQSRARVKTCYDIDTPITVSMLREPVLMCISVSLAVRCWRRSRNALVRAGPCRCIAASTRSDTFRESSPNALPVK